MKKQFFLLSLFAMLFYGCSKNRISQNEGNSNLNIKELLSAFHAQSTSENPQLQNVISSLISRTDTTTAQVGNYYSNQYVSLTLVDHSENINVKVSDLESSQKPSKKSVRKKFAKNQERLIIYLNNGKITDVKTLQISTNEDLVSINKHLSDILNFKKSEFIGEVIFRNLKGKFLYTIHYSKDSFGYSNLTRKKESKLSTIKTSGTIKTNNIECIDWFLITTITYTDGSQSVSEEYVGTTCHSTCQSDPYQPQDFCDDSGNGGGGGELSSEFILTPNIKLCGNYSWTQSGESGGAKNMVMTKLFATFSPKNNPTIVLSARFPEACITIPNYCSMNEITLSEMFTSAFNKAVSSVESRLGTNNGPQIPPGDYFVYEELKKEIQKELSNECLGSVFNNGGCSSNIARNEAKFCPNTK